MMRHAWRIFAALWVFLLVCDIALWIRSINTYYVPLHWTTHGGFVGGGEDCEIMTPNGVVLYRRLTSLGDGHRPSWYRQQKLPTPTRQDLPNWLVRRGFSWEYRLNVEISLLPQVGGLPELSREIRMPMWFPTTLLAIPALMWTAMFVRQQLVRRRNRRGFAPILDANPQGAS